MLTISSRAPSTVRKDFCIDFLFSLLGDIFLMVKTDIYFMVGTGAFLVSHLLFIRGFSFDMRIAGFCQQTKRMLAVKFSLLAFIWGLFVFNSIELWDKIPNKILLAHTHAHANSSHSTQR